MTGYHPNVMAGSCRSGAERDGGKRVHAVAGSPTKDYDCRKALCGKQPGRRSCGWSGYVPANTTVTCPACLKRLAKMIETPDPMQDERTKSMQSHPSSYEE